MNKLQAAKMSIFRKIALSLWKTAGDPSVYGFVEVDVTEIKTFKSPLSLVVKGIGEIMHKNPELNSFRRWGKIYYRSQKNVSVMVNLPFDSKQGLSFSTIYDVDKLNLEQINQKIFSHASLIRAHKDPVLGPVFGIARFLPQSVVRAALGIYSFLIYELKLKTSYIKLPEDPFGSVIVSNVGSLGIKKALLPLVPLTRAGMMVSVGEVSDEACVVQGQIQVRKILHLGVTFDHRLFDGEQAARMLRDFKKFMADQR